MTIETVERRLARTHEADRPTRNRTTGDASRRLSPGGPFRQTGLLVLLLAAATFQSAAARDPDQAELARIERGFRDVINQVSPSVASIRALRPCGVVSLDARHADTEDGWRSLVVVNGTATIIEADGLLLTNEHVVRNAAEILVTFHDGSQLAAELVASDHRSDLAVLRVPRQGLQPARFADWNSVARGQWTVVLGNPFGLGQDGNFSVSVGVISNLGRTLPGLGEQDDRLYANMIQTTAPIHPGNSGGPLFNLRGELVGVVAAMHTRAGVDEGTGFAIPMTRQMRDVVDRLASGGEIAYGYLGVTVRSAPPRLVAPSGALVDAVEEGGPADRADLRIGDVIVRFDDVAVEHADQFIQLVGSARSGRRVPVVWERGGRRMSADVLVERRDPARVARLRD